jgi:large subunit ribosomal protein L17
MRHGKKVNHLSRQTGHRKAMLANMACSLIEHKRINTTVAKAKALKQFVEPLITKSKEDTTHNRRICFAYLRSKYAVTDLFRDVAAKVGDRPGGYTRIIKMGNRLGDNADMAMIELVDFNELYNGGKKEEKKGRTRRPKKSATTTVAPTPAPVVEEVAPIVEEAAPIVEEVVETPAAEVVEEAPAVAEVEETPAAEVVETPVVEVVAPEVVEEAPAVAEVEDSSDSEQAEQTPADEAPATDEGSSDSEQADQSKEEEA